MSGSRCISLFLILSFSGIWYGAYAQVWSDSTAMMKGILTLEDGMEINYPAELAKTKTIHQAALNSGCKSCLAGSSRLLGKYYWSNGEYPAALDQFKQAVDLVSGTGEREILASVYNLMGNTFYYQAYYDSATHYFNEALKVYERDENVQGMITVLHNISLMYHRKGDFQKTIEYLFKEEALKDQLPGNIHAIEAMGAMGSLMIDSLYYTEEIADEWRALRTFKKRGNSKAIYRAYRNIAMAYRQMGEHQLAARYLVKSSTLMKNMGLIPAWDEAAMDYRDANMKDSCYYYHYKAKQDFYRETQPHIGYTMELLGDAHLYFKEPDSALYYYETALRMNYQMNNRLTFTGIHRNLVNAYTQKGNFDEAERHLEIGLKLAKEVALIHEKNLYREGKLLYEKKGDFRNALLYSEKYRIFIDSINRAETALNLTKLQAEFKTAKKIREVDELRKINSLNEERRNLQMALVIVLLGGVTAVGVLYYARYRQKLKSNLSLELQKEVIEHQNVKLQSQNKANEILLSEIHHRVKNNLQIISSLINLKSHQVAPEAAAVLQQLNGRIFSMGLIHEKLYKKESLELIQVDVYLAELGRYLLDSFESTESPIRLLIDCDPVEMNVDQALTCGLICNELFTNSYKYAFAPDQAERSVSLMLKKGKEALTLTIGDNGRNLNGGTKDPGKSFGLRFVDQLVRSKLEGEWSISRESGFVTAIRIPIMNDAND